MNNRVSSSQIDEWKYVLALMKPFAVLSSACGILIFSSDYFQRTLVQWILIVWFYGGLAAFFGIAFGPAIWKSKLRTVFRSNLLHSALIVMISAFIFGIFYSLIPDSQTKYLMPNKYTVHLKKGKYELWYYPRWHRVDQIDDLEDPVDYRPSYEKYGKPQITIKAKNSKKLKIDASKHHYSISFGKSFVTAMLVGTVEVLQNGSYQLSASIPFKRKFVLAVVPPDAQCSGGPYGRRFAGFSDEKVITK